MTTIQNLLHDNVRLLEQGLVLLDGLDEELYARPCASAGLSGPGSHMRHCLDFYDRFLESLSVEAEVDARTGGARLDYDRRRRDEELERSPALARAKIGAVIAELVALVPLARGRTLLVKTDGASEGSDEGPWAGSTVERELQVLSSHTVHHYALIAAALRLQGHAPEPDFGVAPSTLRYWKEQRACAR